MRSASGTACGAPWVRPVLLDDGEQGADLDLVAGGGVQRGERAGGGGGDAVLHLHRLQPQQRLPRLDPVARRRALGEADDGAGHGGEQGAGLGCGRRGR